MFKLKLKPNNLKNKAIVMKLLRTECKSRAARRHHFRALVVHSTFQPTTFVKLRYQCGGPILHIVYEHPDRQGIAMRIHTVES